MNKSFRWYTSPDNLRNQSTNETQSWKKTCKTVIKSQEKMIESYEAFISLFRLWRSAFSYVFRQLKMLTVFLPVLKTVWNFVTESKCFVSSFLLFVCLLDSSLFFAYSCSVCEMPVVAPKHRKKLRYIYLVI